MKRQIVEIPATLEKDDLDSLETIPTVNRPKRAAAYCRVSTASDEQSNSYVNQIEEWTKRLLDDSKYELVKVYGDEGYSGTNMSKRESFQEMLRDAALKKFDIIFCKSISRFGRNSVDIVSSIRQLKSIGVEVFFDTEQMSSFDSKCELLLSIMSSIAQEESRHLSDYTRWGMEKNMKNGIVKMTTKFFLGYDMDKETNNLIINEEEAKIVRYIFENYANGMSLMNIARNLQRKGIKTVTGKTKWNHSTLSGIIRNEKYKGDVEMQKTFVVDYLSHRSIRNKGQRKKYYIYNNHEPIVSKELWDKCNLIMTTNGSRMRGLDIDCSKYSNRSSFSGMIICNSCGRMFKRRQWIQGYETPRIVLQCGGFVDGCCKSSALNYNLVSLALADAINNVYSKDLDIFIDVKRKVLFKYSEFHYLGEIDRLQSQLDQLKEEAYRLRLQRDFTKFNKRIQKQLDKVTREHSEIYNKLVLLRKNRILDTRNKEQDDLLKSILKGKECTIENIQKLPIKNLFYKIIGVAAGNSRKLFIFINTTDSFTQQEVKTFRHKLIKRKPSFTNVVTYKELRKEYSLTYSIILI